MAQSIKLAYLADHHLPFVNPMVTRWQIGENRIGFRFWKSQEYWLYSFERYILTCILKNLEIVICKGRRHIKSRTPPVLIVKRNFKIRITQESTLKQSFRNLRSQSSSLPFFLCYLFNCQRRRFCFKTVTLQNSST